MTDSAKEKDLEVGSMPVLQVPKAIYYIVIVIATMISSLNWLILLPLLNTNDKTKIYSRKVDSVTTNLNIWITSREQKLKRFIALNEQNKKETVTLRAQLVDEKLQPLRLADTYQLYSKDFGDRDKAMREVDSTGRFKIRVRPDELMNKSLLVYHPSGAAKWRKTYGSYDLNTETMVFIYSEQRNDLDNDCSCDTLHNPRAR